MRMMRDGKDETPVHDERTVYLAALTRLFNGCATCGREPLAQTRLFTPEDVLAARTKAFQQAVEMADERFDSLLAARLRRLAEDA